MPPSRHSSSSHHSSSHHSSSHSSSSHSSSFHSSGSSRSSGFSRSSGSISRHSSSSHRSSSYGSSYGSKISSTGSASQFTRYRSNQPRGYSSIVSNPSPKEFHCKNHDYVYYHTAWVDTSTGTYYKKGYYDETGKQYDDILISDGTQTESKFHCPYCDTVIRTAWTEGAKPPCPNCSAQMEETPSDVLIKPVVFSLPGTTRSGENRKSMIKPLMIVLLVLFGIGSQFSDSDYDFRQEPSSYISESSTYYVEEIGRYCVWDSASENYYDAVSDCYFWYNDQIDYPSWQYWYESISSDFGDYGWMEYDEDEAQWYIEIDNGNWIPLPDTYSTADLWYIHQ